MAMTPHAAGSTAPAGAKTFAALRRTDYPIVFVHGFLDEGSLWQPVMDALAVEGVACVAPDLPGMGARAADAGPFTLDCLAEDVASVVAEFDSPIVLVGHSMGAQIAELIAAAHPDRVAALMLLTPVPLGGLPVPEETAAAMRALGGNADGQRDLRRQFAGPHAGDVLDDLVGVGMKVREAVVRALFEAWSSGDPGGQSASQYHGPVLIAAGSDDGFITPELVGSLVTPRFPQASTVLIPGAGHWPHVERPLAVSTILSDFRASNTRAQGK